MCDVYRAFKLSAYRSARRLASKKAGPRFRVTDARIKSTSAHLTKLNDRWNLFFSLKVPL